MSPAYPSLSLTDVFYKDADQEVSAPVNIGFEFKPVKTSRSQRIKQQADNKKNTELEKAARLRECK